MKFQTKQEFEIYALMYVMALDMRTSKEELKLMKTKASEELIQNVSELFENDNDAQRVETIVQGAAEFLKTPEQKVAFLNNMKMMAAADSIVNIEAAGLAFLEKMIMS